MKIVPINSVTAHENKDLCSKCGGKCCEGIPGVYHPEDLFPNMSDAQIQEKILAMIEQGDTVITDMDVWTDPDSTWPTLCVKALAPRGKGLGNSWRQSFNGGRCVNLTLTGCKLSTQDRPYECRIVIPVPTYSCRPEEGFHRQDLFLEWYIYDHVLEAVEDHLYETKAIHIPYQKNT